MTSTKTVKDRIDYYDGKLDDVVIGAESVHFEMLSDKCLWIAVNKSEGERVVFTVGVDSRGQILFEQIED